MIPLRSLLNGLLHPARFSNGRCPGPAMAASGMGDPGTPRIATRYSKSPGQKSVSLLHPCNLPRALRKFSVHVAMAQEGRASLWKVSGNSRNSAPAYSCHRSLR